MNTTKALTAKLLTVAALATAFAIIPTSARAQAFAVGVQFGHPGYYRPAPSLPYLPFDRRDDFIRRQEFERQQAFIRERDFRAHEAFEHRRFDDRRRW
jgi:hypothetical protein